MKKFCAVMLCLALVVCFVWGCTLSAQKDGLTKENRDMSRKYEVLQALYRQLQEDFDAEKDGRAADKRSLENEAVQWRQALQQAQTAYRITADALRRQAEEATAAADAFSDVSENVSLFALPQTSPAPTEEAVADEAVETTPEPTPVTEEEIHPAEDAEAEAQDEPQATENTEETPIPEEAEAEAEAEAEKDAEENTEENTGEDAEADGDDVPLG